MHDRNIIHNLQKTFCFSDAIDIVRFKCIARVYKIYFRAIHKYKMGLAVRSAREQYFYLLVIKQTTREKIIAMFITRN